MVYTQYAECISAVHVSHCSHCILATRDGSGAHKNTGCPVQYDRGKEILNWISCAILITKQQILNWMSCAMEMCGYLAYRI